MTRKTKATRFPSGPSRFSRENYYGEHWVALFFIQQPSTWHTMDEIASFLNARYRNLKRGTLSNILSRLKQRGLLESRRGIPSEYRLLDAVSKNHPIGVRGRQYNALRPIVLKIGLLDYLKTLSFENVRRIHDIRLWTPVTEVDFVDKDWHYVKHQRVFWRREMVEGKYRFSIRAYEKVRTLDISVACANSPVAVDEKGLSNLNDALWVARTKFLNSPSVPYPSRWTITQWHCGKDAKNTIARPSFEVTWSDFYGNLVRVYTRDKFDGKIRVERVESPNDFVENLLGSPENAIKKMMGEPITCVEDSLLTSRTELASKVSTGNAAPNVAGAEVLPLAQILHV